MNTPIANGHLRTLSPEFLGILSNAGVKAPQKAIVFHLAETEDEEIIAVQTSASTLPFAATLLQLTENADGSINLTRLNDTLTSVITTEEIKKRVNSDAQRKAYNDKQGRNEKVIFQLAGQEYQLWTWKDLGNDSSWISIIPLFKSNAIGKKITGKW